MATDFPNSPANGATHTFGGTTYTYSTSVGAWTAGSSAGGASVTVSETAPSSPAEGDLWFDPSVLKTFVYYNDGSANQWVQSNPTGSGGGGSAGASVTASDTAPSSPSAGDLWYKSDTNALYVYYNDGDSSQWVGVSGPAGATGATGAAGAAATGYGQVPIVYTEPPTTHELNKDGSTSTVQMQAVDPEGTAITYAIAYANSTNARPDQLATDTAINQSTGTFTFDPSTNSAHAGSFKARLSASDGITHATRFVDFNLQFTVAAHFLVVGGGGGGAGWSGGGGGAGGLRTSFGSTSGGGASAQAQLQLTPGATYTATVGAGGAGGNNVVASNYEGVNGSNSSFSGTGITTVTALGGGYGGGGNAASAGGNGGSGGGGGTALSGGTGATGEGYAGGTGAPVGHPYGHAGGGGAGGVGADGANGSDSGVGGAGLQVNIDGNNYYWAGGGGGGAHNGTGTNWSNGGIGGGGGGAGYEQNGTGGGSALNSGANGTTSGGAGGANTGGGGGGGQGGGNPGGAGGSGIVIIRLPQAATSTTGSPTVTTVGGDTVYTFLSNGTLTI